MKSRRIFAFDAIRILAMLSIVIFHYNATCIELDIAARPIFFISYANGTMGHIGVSLFFVLSGASLMVSSQKAFSLKTYLYRRFLSIYPLYWIVYAAFFTHFYIINRLPMTIPKWTLLLSLLGFDGYLYYRLPCYYLVGEWFVGCIVLIYLVFPLLRRLLLARPYLTTGAAFFLLIPYALLYPLDMSAEHFFAGRIPEVLFGMLLSAFVTGQIPAPAAGCHASGGLLSGAPDSQKKAAAERRHISAFAGLFSLAVFLVFIFVPTDLPSLICAALTGCSLFTFLLWLLQGADIPALSFAARQICAISFSVFLCHHLLAGLLLGKHAGETFAPVQNLRMFAGYFLFTCFCAAVFYGCSRILCRILNRLTAAFGIR